MSDFFSEMFAHYLLMHFLLIFKKNYDAGILKLQMPHR